jgi:hypothetical protein
LHPDNIEYFAEFFTDTGETAAFAETVFLVESEALIITGDNAREDVADTELFGVVFQMTQRLAADPLPRIIPADKIADFCRLPEGRKKDCTGAVGNSPRLCSLPSLGA